MTCGTFGEPGDFAVWRLRRGGELKEVRVDARVSVPDPTINHQLALAGTGVALLAQSMVGARMSNRGGWYGCCRSGSRTQLNSTRFIRRS
jgi:DNA-binding transcriptional LysR family regulator